MLSCVVLRVLSAIFGHRKMIVHAAFAGIEQCALYGVASVAPLCILYFDSRLCPDFKGGVIVTLMPCRKKMQSHLFLSDFAPCFYPPGAGMVPFCGMLQGV
jgi:hypothetical protein